MYCCSATLCDASLFLLCFFSPFVQHHTAGSKKKGRFSYTVAVCEIKLEIYNPFWLFFVFINIKFKETVDCNNQPVPLTHCFSCNVWQISISAPSWLSVYGIAQLFIFVCVLLPDCNDFAQSASKHYDPTLLAYAGYSECFWNAETITVVMEYYWLAVIKCKLWHFSHSFIEISSVYDKTSIASAIYTNGSPFISAVNVMFILSSWHAIQYYIACGEPMTSNRTKTKRPINRTYSWMKWEKNGKKHRWWIIV